ncbi:MAG: PA14 domain-containing protein [Cyanobacteria bacterium]|nr:PA14 domain-containing protein [Cyanobacteriota bacterium]
MNDVTTFFNTATPTSYPSANHYGSNGANISTLTNAAIGVSSADVYSVQWLGYFKTTTAGTYAFRTNSDDCSYLWIGDSAVSNYTASNAVVNNAGLHGMRTISGSALLAANSYYYVRLQFGENGGGDDIQLSMLAPGQSDYTYDLSSYLFSYTGNSPPVIGGAGNAVVYLENASAITLSSVLTVSDVDNTSLSGATVTISAGFTSGDSLSFPSQNGITGSYDSGTGVLSLTGTATVADYQAALRSLSYSSTSDNPTVTSANRTISWQVNDGSSLSALVTSAINITALNDAPAITSGSTYNFTTTNEDTTSPAIAASTLLTAASWVDVDTSALSALAITATTGNGTWQYSTDGTTWQAFGSVSSTKALLLASTSQVRYGPDGNNGETATFAYKAWDQTTGSASTGATANYATTAASGGTSAFSINTSSAQIIVSSINDAPILDSTQSPVLNTIAEDTLAPVNASTANSTLISDLVAGISDVDPSALKGIAITAVNSANGSLYYSTNGGSTWTLVGSVSSTASLLLAGLIQSLSMGSAEASAWPSPAAP